MTRHCALLLCAEVSLAGCARTGNTVASVEAVPGREAVPILQNVKTTQYFTDEAVAQTDVETILQAGVNAPSAMNSQPWHFSVITDETVLEQLSNGMGFGTRPQGAPDGELAPPEGFVPGEAMPEGMEFSDGAAPEGMSFPEGQPPAAPGGGSMNKAGIADAPLVIVISCKTGSELDAGLACQNMSGTAQLLGYGTKIITSATMALNGSGQDALRQQLGIPEGYTGATSRNPMDDMVTFVSADGT